MKTIQIRQLEIPAVDYNKPSSYKQAIKYTDDLIERLNIMSPVLDAGNEAFADFLRSTIIGIGNIVGHIGHTFKTNVFKAFSKLKRSEWRYESESNAFSTKYFLRIPYNELVDVQIPFYLSIE